MFRIDLDCGNRFALMSMLSASVVEAFETFYISILIFAYYQSDPGKDFIFKILYSIVT